MGRETILKITGAVSIIVLLSNLNAIVDLVLHPEIPYFDREHLIVGGITGIVMTSLFCSLAFYTRHLNRAMIMNTRLEKDRQRVITELTLTLSELETIYNSAKVGLCVIDNQLRFIRINQHMAELNGFKVSEHIGRSLRDLLPGLADKAEELMDRVVESGKPILDVEITGETPARPGVERTWLENWIPLKDESGKVVRINIVAVEITERKKDELVLEQYRQQLERQVADRTAEIETRNVELQRLNAIIRNLSRRTIEAMESDRRTLSKEIHDSIAGTLAAIKLNLEGWLNPSAQGLSPSDLMPLEKIVEHLTQAVKETKVISRQLRSTILDDFGLKSALFEHIQQFNEFYPRIEIVSQIEIADRDVPPDVQTVVYRVVQEALNNVGRHSAATMVRIELTNHQNQICLELSDNGCGFDLEDVLPNGDSLKGYGIHSMRERVALCKGEFQIHSAPGKGTAIDISIPI